MLEKDGVADRLEWRVFIAENGVPNAYALSGGRITWNTGILDKFDNLD
jgi:hypothetical protein